MRSRVAVARALLRVDARTIVATLAVACGVAAAAHAEASHHTGSNVAQFGVTDLQSLSRTRTTDWDVRVFTTALFTSGKFDDAGNRTSLGEGNGISNYGLNAFFERRLGERFAVSALVAGQVLVIDQPTGSQTITSLSDSLLSGRYTVPFSWGSLSAVATVKLPGTYPESEATGAKQIDAEAKVVVALPRLLARVSPLIGVGYKLRLSAIMDELTATLAVPVDLGFGLTATAFMTGAVPVGPGTAKNTVLPGANLAWRFTEAGEVAVSYSRTVAGRNVVEANVFMASLLWEL